ncbi:nuclear transport factor 2 family protein [Neisseria dentiae]|uniref:nuclear transport factor 2 family protein n=1 Tax=Neisseria dentiae TaxID=194197 RepID=UPI0035A1B592
MNLNATLTQAVQALINAGCHYHLEELAQCYTQDLQIVMLQPNGETAIFDYEQNMAFFQNLRDSGAAPINTTVTFNYAQEYNGIGYVMATRLMNFGAGEQKIIFTLMLRQEAGKWRVFREHAVIQAA